MDKISEGTFNINENCRVPANDQQNKTFDYPVSMKRNKSSFVCNICQKSFATNYLLLQHRRLQHRKQFGVSHERFSRKTEAETTRHEFRYYCDLCSLQYCEKRTLIAHMARHINGYQFKCLTCNAIFDNSVMLRKHIREIHDGSCYRQEAVCIFSCKVCGKKFRDEKICKNHEKVMHFSLFSCAICNQLFPRHQLKAHMNRCSSAECNLKCSKCPKKFKTLKLVKNHQKRHKKFICDICGRQDHMKIEIEYHLLSHLDPNFLKCKICEKTFTRKASFLTHNKRYHGGGKRKPMFRSDKCGTKFIRKSTLITHMKVYHGDESNVMEYEDFIKQYQDDVNFAHFFK